MNHPAITLSRSAWLNPATALVATALALVTACGGGGDAAGPPAVVPPGDPVTATVGAAGGSIVFSASGVAARLSFPAGVLAADQQVVVTPVAPAAGEWLRVRINGPQGVLEAPATLEFTAPQGVVPGGLTSGLATVGGRTLPLPTRVDRGTRVVSIDLQVFAGGAPEARALALRPGPMAAAPGDTEVAAVNPLSLDDATRALKDSLSIESSQYDYIDAAQAVLALVQLQMAVGSDDAARDAARINASLEGIKTNQVCPALSEVVARGLAEPAPTAFDPEGNVARSWTNKIVAPILYWHATASKFGGAPCRDVDPPAAITTIQTRLLDAIGRKLRERQDAATLKGTVGEVAATKLLKERSGVLQVAPLGQQMQTELITPALAPVRTANWQRSADESSVDGYRQLIAAFGQDTPLSGDIQLSGTTLQVGSYSDAAATQVEGQAAIGRKATPEASIKAWTVSAKAGGRVSLEGPIQVLKCPLPASERLVVEFEGAEVLNQASSGDLLLQGTLSFEINRLLDAAGIQAANATQHVLRLWRKGSGCNASFGLGDATVAEITLDFSKTCRAAPGTTHCVTVLTDETGSPVTGWGLVDGTEDGTLLLEALTSDPYRDPVSARWKAGRLTQLPADFHGTAVSATGTVAGVRYTADPIQETGPLASWAAYWRNGAVTTVGPKNSWFHDINDSDLMVGDYRQVIASLGVYFPGLRSNGGAAPELAVNQNSTLRAVNNAGVVCMENAALYAPQLPKCIWINEHGWLDISTGRAKLVMNSGAERTGPNWFRAGPRHAIAYDATNFEVTIVDMATNLALPVPTLDPAGGVRQDNLPLARLTRARVDTRGRMAVELDDGRLAVLTPNGVDKR